MYTKKKPIRGLREGERVEDIFVVKFKKGIFPYQNGYGFQLLLSDSSGKSIDYKYWGDRDENKIKEVYDSVKSDSVVLLNGKVQSFKGRMQISTNPQDGENIRALKEGEYDPGEFIMPPRRNIEEMVAEFNQIIESVKNSDVKRLLKRVFIEDKDFLDKFKLHPGSIEIHHNWTGGLLQHILEVMRYCELTKNMFGDLDRDILIAGAILHDIGKVFEIDVTSRIKGSRKGNLKGHIALGFRFVSNVMDELKISEDVRDKILHIILSHHGSLEFGSPKVPMFPEAFAIYYADEMSSKLAELIDFVKDSREATEDEFMFHKRYSRNIFLK